MNELDKFIKKVINEEIDEPYQYEQAIRTALNKKNKTKYFRYKFKKMVLASSFGIILSMGVVYAGYNVYEKVWKEPAKYDYQEMLDSMPNEIIIEEEKKELMTEEEAKEIAITILEKLGYIEQVISRIELNRSYDESTSSYYMVKTKYGYEEGLMVQLDATTGEFLYFNDLDLKYKNYTPDKITKEQMEKIGKQVYTKLDMKDGDFELYEAREEESVFESNTRKLNGVKFYRKYEGISNKYENFSASFIVVNGKVLYDTIILEKKSNFDNNTVVISKQDAIDIATNKEKEFSKLENERVEARLSIERMNTFIYQLENELYNTDPTDGGTYLDIDEKIRKVWVVEIEHKDKTSRAAKEYIENPNQYIKEVDDKIYYVDATTGEIIGGSLIKK